jgi:hypothetical protein
MADIPHHRRSPLDHGRDVPDLSDEALDALDKLLRKVVLYLSDGGMTSLGSDAADTIAALRAQLAREREAGDRLVTAIDRVTGKAWASIATMEDAAYLDGTLAAFRAAREGGGEG